MISSLIRESQLQSLQQIAVLSSKPYQLSVDSAIVCGFHQDSVIASETKASSGVRGLRRDCCGAVAPRKDGFAGEVVIGGEAKHEFFQEKNQRTKCGPEGADYRDVVCNLRVFAVCIEIAAALSRLAMARV